MLKATVLIPFTDKHTGKKHKKDDVLEITAKRFNEILEKGKLIQLVDDEPTTTKKKENK